MTKRQGKSGAIDVKAVLAEDEEFVRALVRSTPPAKAMLEVTLGLLG